MNKKLTYQLIKTKEISSEQFSRMFNLMHENYDYVTFDNFCNDLKHKTFAGLLFDEDSDIQGFTTFGINPKEYKHKDYNILFSGDTVVSSSYIGSQELGKGWCRTVGMLLSKYPDKKWMWYLMSKGYKTYLYLPFFFNKFYPSPSIIEHKDYSLIIDECSTHFFGDDWKSNEGIVRFKDRLGQVKKEHAEKSFRKNNEYVDFFLRKNPGFVDGDEMVCMAELSLNNFKRYPRRIISKVIESSQDFEFNIDER